MYLISFTLSLMFAAMKDIHYRELKYSSLISLDRKKLLDYLLAILTVLPLCILGIFRYGIGTDYNLYKGEYYSVSIGGKPHYDSGFTFINKVAIRFHFGYQFVIALSFLLFISGIYFFAFKYCSDRFFFITSLLIFSYNYFIAYSMIAQYAALGMLFFSFSFLLDDNYCKSIICALVATSLHVSACFFIVLIVLYWFFSIWRGVKTKLLLTVLMITTIIICLGMPLVFYILKKTRFAGYLTDATYSGLTSMSFIIINTVVAIFQIYLVIRNKKIAQSSGMDIMLFIQFLAMLLSFLQGSITLLFRFIYYLSAFSIVSLPIFIKQINNKFLRNVISVLTISSFVIWWIAFPMKNDYYHVIPYVSIFGGRVI